VKALQELKALLIAACCCAIANPARAELIYGLEANQTLFAFDSANTSVTTTIGTLSGIPAGHSVIGIDLRPATHELYAVTFNQTALVGYVFSVNKQTAVLTVVGSSFTLPSAPKSNQWGIDFNPAVDRIRVVNADGQNFRLSPLTGAIAGTDTNISPATTELTGVAYSDNVAGVSAATLYAYDFKNDKLGMVGGVNGSPSPNSGVFTSIGSSGIIAYTSDLDLDISGTTGTGYAVVRSEYGNRSSLYTFSTSSGAFTRVGDFRGRTVSDLTASPGTYVPPVVYYKVSLKVQPASYGKVSGSGKYAAGSRVTLNAKPIGGRTFVGWYEANVRISKKPLLVISHLTANRTLTAKFK
jgi:trimeric autotransporter adhesin